MVNTKLKLLFATFLLIIFRYVYVLNFQQAYEPKSGDLIFQAEIVPNGIAIQAITMSRYNHVGIVMKRGGKFYVYEAIGSVTRTPLKKYISRNGTYGKFRVMRLNDNAKPFNYSRVMTEISKLYGKRYDFNLGWSDNRVYCSELVYKVINRGTGTSLTNPKTINQRPFINILSMIIKTQFKIPSISKTTQIVTPGEISSSSKLTTVYTNQLLFL
jgi:hypothetical protein